VSTIHTFVVHTPPPALTVQSTPALAFGPALRSRVPSEAFRFDSLVFPWGRTFSGRAERAR